MRMTSLFTGFVMAVMPAGAQVSAYPAYKGNDLGLIYSPQQSSFRIWAPSAEAARLILYRNGVGGKFIQNIAMKKGEQGTWTHTIPGDHQGKFYTFLVRVNDVWLEETPDPYAKIVGLNGERALITDLHKTNPGGWESDRSPSFLKPTDAIIYELHVRDASISGNSGISAKGKFAGLAESATRNAHGQSTGLDHLKELGVTHVHLLPFFDFLSVNESRPDSLQYNWGYDPLNYNAPEGSYSSNAGDGVTRIKELKQMIQTFHQNGLRIVMDVVYNHTGRTENSSFNRLVPGYYYRQTQAGTFSNATACGNEMASERPMVRKFMIESLLYWAKEYHIDGFRFDLMGVHDIETMNLISKELRKLRPDILLYGEGWTAGSSTLPEDKRAIKKFAYKLDHIAVFSDDLRDGIKGSVFREKDKGFVSGEPGLEESIKFGVVAACKHPQVNYSKVNYSKAPYAQYPANTVSYAECHDNHTLWDKLAISASNVSETERREMHKLALSIVLTSQGVCFLHAGTEFLRSKNGNENSYNAGDSINAIDWDLKTKNKDVFEYVAALIAMRKQHPAFRMNTSQQIADAIRFDTQTGPGLVAYTINGATAGDSWKKIQIVYNATDLTVTQQLPAGEWRVFAEANRVSKEAHKVMKEIATQPRSCTILFQVR